MQSTLRCRDAWGFVISHFICKTVTLLLLQLRFVAFSVSTLKYKLCGRKLVFWKSLMQGWTWIWGTWKQDKCLVMRPCTVMCVCAFVRAGFSSLSAECLLMHGPGVYRGERGGDWWWVLMSHATIWVASSTSNSLPASGLQGHPSPMPPVSQRLHCTFHG